jgi:hypothetical protein
MTDPLDAEPREIPSILKRVKKQAREAGKGDVEFLLLTVAEKRIVEVFESGGMSRREALDRLYRDLDDAAEEDGYDGA